MEKKYKIKLKYTKPFDQLSAEEQFDFMDDVDSQWDEKRKQWRKDNKIYLIVPVLILIYLFLLPHLNLSKYTSVLPYMFFIPVIIAITSGFIYGYKLASRGF